MRSFFEPADGAGWRPTVDMYATDGEIVMLAEVPGLSGQDIEVIATKDRVTIRGEYKSPDVPGSAQVLKQERRAGKFTRTFVLPVSVKPEEVRATCKDGLLEIRLPKIDEMRPHSVKVMVVRQPKFFRSVLGRKDLPACQAYRHEQETRRRGDEKFTPVQ